MTTKKQNKTITKSFSEAAIGQVLKISQQDAFTLPVNEASKSIDHTATLIKHDDVACHVLGRPDEPVIIVDPRGTVVLIEQKYLHKPVNDAGVMFAPLHALKPYAIIPGGLVAIGDRYVYNSRTTRYMDCAEDAMFWVSRGSLKEGSASMEQGNHVTLDRSHIKINQPAPTQAAAQPAPQPVEVAKPFNMVAGNHGKIIENNTLRFFEGGSREGIRFQLSTRKYHFDKTTGKVGFRTMDIRISRGYKYPSQCFYVETGKDSNTFSFAGYTEETDEKQYFEGNLVALMELFQSKPDVNLSLVEWS